MNKKYFVIVIAILLVTFGIAGLYIQSMSSELKSQKEVSESNMPDIIATTTGTKTEVSPKSPSTPKTTAATPAQKCTAFVVTSPLPNSVVNFPTTITGVLDYSTGCKNWTIDGGRAGTIDLEFYEAGTWRTISKNTALTPDAIGQTITNVTATMTFDNGGIGLPQGQQMRFVIKAEQGGSGLPSNNEQIVIPFIFGTTKTNDGLHPN